MTIKLSSLGGSKPLGFVGLQSDNIAAGATGDVLTITAGDKQYLRLTYLLTVAGTVQAGMTLTVDGVDVFTNLSLADVSPAAYPNTASVFGVCQKWASSNPYNGARLLSVIECKTFTLTKVSGSTAQAISYACETLGEIE